MSSHQIIRVGVIGMGNMGAAHAACISAGKIHGLVLNAFCENAPERLEHFRKVYPDLSAYENWEDMLQNPSIDAVIIAVPHPLHTTIAIEALRAGKHVQLEKPVDVSVTRAAQLNAVAQQTDRVFSITFNQRTNALFQKAREIVSSGQLGELKRSVWIITNWYRTQHYYNSGTWRATWSGEGGGVLLNQAPHNLDLWQWICGMPCEITGFCDIAKYHDIEVEDDVTIFARYANGATGSFITSTGEYPGTNRLEISGTLGKLVLENGLLKWWKLRQSERQFCRESDQCFTGIPFDYTEIAPDHPESAHAGILQNFTNAILHGEPLLAPGIEGIHSLMISNAAYLSAWNGSTPVSLPIDADAFDRGLAERVALSQEKHEKSEEAYNNIYKQRWQINW